MKAIALAALLAASSFSMAPVAEAGYIWECWPKTCKER